MQLLLSVVARGIALFFGLFSLSGALAEWRAPGFFANEWWISLRGLPAPAALSLVALSGAFFLLFALRPRGRRWRQWTTATLALVLLGFAVDNTATVVRLHFAGEIAAPQVPPFSVLVAAALAVVAAGTAARPGGRPLVTLAASTTVAGACGLAMAVALMLQFGKTDYRRDSDAIVVFGARAYADGRASDALKDRVRTGCELFREGYAPLLILSGGPGDGAVHETEAMRRLARDAGVPDEAIVLDAHGVNTRATVANVTAMRDESPVSDILAVSHFYHLPRIKMAFQRSGMNAYTVPARESYTLSKLPHFMAREIAAFWWYHLSLGPASE